MSADNQLSAFVCTAIARAVNRDPATVRPDTVLLELDLDSLTLVSVLAQVEAVHEIELTPEVILSLLEATRVSELVSRIEAVLAVRPDP